MPTTHGLAALALGGALLLLAPAAGAADEAVRQIGGRYAVKGETSTEGVRETRAISGTIVIQQTGDSFTSHSELKTVAPGTEASSAVVIGTGAGRIVGNKLSGDADIQLIVSEIPGIDTSFGLAPTATTSRRIKSSWDATVGDDGSITVESVNVPAEGETDYRPTTTRLVGMRSPADKSSD